MSSLLRKIAGTITADQFSGIDDVLEKNASLSQETGFPAVMQLLSLALAPAQTKTASTELEFSVLQLVPERDGYLLKIAEPGKSPAKATEKKISRPEAKKSLPPEVVETADQQGVATIAAQPSDPAMFDIPNLPVTVPGMYKVTTADGLEVAGFVLPSLMDPATGGPTGMSLFTTGGQFALQETPFEGQMLSSSLDLPMTSRVRGQGIFYRQDGRRFVATVPYTIANEVSTPAGTYFAGTDLYGQPVQIHIAEGLEIPISSGMGEVVIPRSYNFLALDNPIEMTAPDMAPVAQKLAMANTFAKIAMFGDRVRLTGPVFEKVGSGLHSIPDGLFYLAAAGLTQAQSLGFMEQARHTAIEVCGLRPLEEDAAVKVASAPPHMPRPVNLFEEAVLIASGIDKVANASLGPATVDTMLSLGFITPENIQEFVDALPQLEAASSELAKLGLAVQVGLPSIPESAVARALGSIETVIEGVKSLNYVEV